MNPAEEKDRLLAVSLAFENHMLSGSKSSENQPLGNDPSDKPRRKRGHKRTGSIHSDKEMQLVMGPSFKRTVKPRLVDGSTPGEEIAPPSGQPRPKRGHRRTGSVHSDKEMQSVLSTPIERTTDHMSVDRSMPPHQESNPSGGQSRPRRSHRRTPSVHSMEAFNPIPQEEAGEAEPSGRMETRGRSYLPSLNTITVLTFFFRTI